MGSSQLKSILDAASEGDTEFLMKAYEDNVGDLRSYFLGREDTECRNLLHVAVESDSYTFLYEALNILSLYPHLVIDLICQPQNGNSCNPLHIAAMGGNIFTVKLLVNAYGRAVALVGMASLIGKRGSNEDIARYLVSQDQNLLRTMGKDRYPMDLCSTLIVGYRQTSIVFDSMGKGYSLLVEQILTSDLPYSVKGNTSGETPLHYASRCSEKVSRLLLERHPELIGKVSDVGKSVLDKAIEYGATWLVKLMLIEDEGVKYTIGYQPPPWIKACRRLIWHTNKKGDTALHVAARKGNIDIAKLVLLGQKSAIQDEATEWDGAEAPPGNDLLGANPLHIKNRDTHMPLAVALINKHDDCGVMLSKETFPLGEDFVKIALHWELLLAAHRYGCQRSAKTILATIVTYGSMKVLVKFKGKLFFARGVREIFSYLFSKYKELGELLKSEEMEKLSEVLLEVLREQGKDAETLLKEAAERGEDWLVRLFLESNKELIKESAPAWQVACEKGYLSTLFTFINMFGHQEFVEYCQDSKQSPLHHIKLEEYGKYVELLKMPVMDVLKNQIDGDGATPLHRAIQSDDLELTKALLETKGIDVTIKDKNGTTAFDLLENRCKFSKSWGKMCREIKQDSTVQKLKYLFRKISFEGMQNTLSLVAALVATITYAAGLNVPGSVDNKDGSPTLATKAAFLAFSISNMIAMCSSVMVLFLLLGPMMWDPQPSLFYVNLSLFLLLLSLGGTLLAFMTGVYATMVPKVEWNAIFVIVSCSLTLFVACIVLLLTYSPQLKTLALQSFRWLKKVNKSNPPPTPTQQGQLLGNTIMQQDQSPVVSATSSTPPVNPQSDNQNTSQLSAGPSDIQLPANVLPSDQQSGSTKTPVTQPSGIPLTAAPELGQQAYNPNWEAGQSSGTSPMAPEDTKIDITST